MTGVKAQAEALLNGITPGEWRTYAHIDGTALYSARTPQPHEHFTEDEEPVHLIAENKGSVDAELCRNAPTLARQVVELAEEVERLRGALTGVLALYPADMRGRPGEEHLWGFKPEVIKTIESARAALAGSPS